MLVDINLLPQKETKRSLGLISILIAIVITGLLFIALWFYYQAQLQTVDQLSRELKTNQELRQVYETKQKTVEVSPAEELEQAVTWAETNQKQTFLLMDHITNLLPERGFIQNFSYESAGILNLSVQFDTSRQAADFLNHMKASTYMESVDLESISTTELEENEIESETLPRYVANYSIKLQLDALSAIDDKKEETS